MKRKIFSLILFFILIPFITLLGSCRTKESYPVKEFVYTERYEAVKINADPDLTGVTSIIKYKDRILFLTENSENLYFLNLNGKAGVVRKLDTSNAEFLSADENYLYVIDSGFRKILTLDSAFNLVRELDISNIIPDPLDKVYSFYPHNNAFIISVFSEKKQNAFLYKIDSEGKINKTGSKTAGIIGEDSEGDPNYIKSFDYDKNSYINKDTIIYKIEDNRLTEKKRLPDNYNPILVEYIDGSYYIFSYNYFQLDKYDNNFEYIETLYKTPDLKQEQSSTKIIYLGKKDFLIVNPYTNELTFLRAKKEEL